MRQNLIPSIYEALPVKQTAQIQVFPSIFESKTNPNKVLTQIAYYSKKQWEIKEELAERARQQSYINMVKNYKVYQKKKIGQQPPQEVKYRFLVPNRLGFPIFGSSFDLEQLNNVCRNAFGATVRDWRRISAYEIANIGDVNIVEREDDNFKVKIYIFRAY